MGLQLRVSHALGARVVEVEPRGPQRPIVIGRSPQADVQVPIGTVAPSHCVLYMDEDQWVIQDNGSSTGTYVNGREIGGPVYLNFGDVVRLGESEGGPTIEIDPMGAGRRMGEGVGRPAKPTEQETQDFYEEKVRSVPATAKEQSDWPVEEEEGSPEADWVGAGPIGAAGHRRRRRPVKKKEGNFVPIAVGGTLAVILITWFIAAKLLKEDEPTPVVDEKPRDVRGGGNGGKSIFEFPDGEKDKAKTTPQTQNDVAVIPPVAVPAPDKTAKPVAAVDNDPARQSDEWKAVVEANSGSGRPELALWTIVDYRRLHPGKFESELKQFEDAAFDRLWWERIRDLCEKRDSLAMEIERKNSEIAQETEAAYKAKLEKEKEGLVFRRQAAMDALTEMGWTAKAPPNLFDAGQIANLRRQRIAETYEGWKRRVTNSLMKTRGLPW